MPDPAEAPTFANLSGALSRGSRDALSARFSADGRSLAITASKVISSITEEESSLESVSGIVA